MNYVVESRNGWEMICKENYWMIKRPVICPQSRCNNCHTGTEKYIRKLWNESYRPWSQNM